MQSGMSGLFRIYLKFFLGLPVNRKKSEVVLSPDGLSLDTCRTWHRVLLVDDNMFDTVDRVDQRLLSVNDGITVTKIVVAVQ